MTWVAILVQLGGGALDRTASLYVGGGPQMCRCGVRSALCGLGRGWLGQLDVDDKKWYVLEGDVAGCACPDRVVR